MPSWLGDAVMATPALRLVREAHRGALLGLLVRPGIDEVLAGLDLFDEVHADRPVGMMGPKRVAARVRARRYDGALLLTNSFSSALVTRLAGIPRRVGYDRDSRGLLLTQRLRAPRRDGGWAPVPAVVYYHHAARCFIDPATPALAPERAGPDPYAFTLPPGARLELAVTQPQARVTADLLARAGIEPGSRWAVLNPGGNNPAKRWPIERFAAISDHLFQAHGCHVLVNGSPGETELIEALVVQARAPVVNLARLGVTIGSLKGIVRGAAILVTNDTGPRHFAGAFGVPLVTLFGPTDPRWTTIPAAGGETILRADPTLPAELVADDHPERCRVDRITVEAVREAVDRALARPAGEPRVGAEAPGPDPGRASHEG